MKIISVFYLSEMFICTFAVFTKSSKKKDAEIEKEIVEVFKYVSHRGNKA